MRTSTSCGWCHTMNPITERFCKECGHEAHVSRMLCRCPRCARTADQGDAASITTATEAVETVLAGVRGRQRGMNWMTCVGCGNPLECFEGEVYCPDCTRFEPTDCDLDRLCLLYLDALDRLDFDTLAGLWSRAECDPALERALHELHETLDSEEPAPSK